MKREGTQINELKELMTIHQRNEIDRLYESRNEEQVYSPVLRIA